MRRRFIVSSAGALFVTALAAGMLGSARARAQQDAGRAAFDRVCATCHGPAGAGGSAPALVPLRHSDADMLTIVRQGGAQMPALPARTVTDADVARIGRYLRGLGVNAAAPLGGAASASPSGTTTIDRAVKVSPITDAMLATPNPAD